MKLFYALALVLVPISSIAQTSNPHYDLPPAAPPSSCAFALGGVNTPTGPIASKRLGIQLRAPRSGQEAVAVAEGKKGLDSESSPALAMSSAVSGIEQARDALSCSASLIAKYKPVDDDYSHARILLIVAYNQEAAAMADMEALIKEQFLRRAGERT